MVPKLLLLLMSLCALEACTSNREAVSRDSINASGHLAPPPDSDHTARRSKPTPVVIGESFTIASRALGETRRMNVFIPTTYGELLDAPLPVLYMLDGGVSEDFLHIAGLVQVLVSNGGMRPFMLVGVENTQRRRDMTGPTTSEDDRKIAPVVGGSAAFRRFIKDELMPEVRARYRTTDEAAVIGESLAGLFVLETFVLEPDTFGTYIAIDPSLWWNNGGLVTSIGVQGRPTSTATPTNAAKAVVLASSNEPSAVELTASVVGAFEVHQRGGVEFRHMHFPGETHATIYHPAALAAIRALFAPAKDRQ